MSTQWWLGSNSQQMPMNFGAETQTTAWISNSCGADVFSQAVLRFLDDNEQQ